MTISHLLFYKTGVILQNIYGPSPLMLCHKDRNKVNLSKIIEEEMKIMNIQNNHLKIKTSQIGAGIWGTCISILSNHGINFKGLEGGLWILYLLKYLISKIPGRGRLSIIFGQQATYNYIDSYDMNKQYSH